MTTALRWSAAVLLTWILADTVLGDLVKKFGVDSIGFAIVLNMALPIWVVVFFAIADPPIDHPWLEVYFRTRGWERAGKRYRAFGVLQFQAVLKKWRIGVFSMRPSDFRVTNDAGFLKRMERDTRAAETAHGICFAIVASFAVYALATDRPAGAAWLLMGGIVCQAYPMLLQRYHRPRWRRVLHQSALVTSASTGAAGFRRPDVPPRLSNVSD